MSGERDVGSHVYDMIEACERILAFTQGVPNEQIVEDDAPIWGAVLHNLAVMGEAAKHVPQEIKDQVPGVDWKRIAGMRDKIIHYYFGIDSRIVLTAVHESIPAVLPQLRALLARLDAQRAESVRGS